MPVLASDVATLGRATDVEDDTEKTAKSVNKTRDFRNVAAVTYMKPITAMTLMEEKINSASP
jgi:hypothetical protein